MTRVDFYVMDNPSARQHGHLVYRLAEKAWREGHRVHIRCDSSESAVSLDDLLWSYKDTSFLPHAKSDDPEASTAPITIGHGSDLPATTDILINVAADVPDYFSRFERVMETIGSDDSARVAARGRYRYYQERGYALNTHKLETTHG